MELLSRLSSLTASTVHHDNWLQLFRSFILLHAAGPLFDFYNLKIGEEKSFKENGKREMEQSKIKNKVSTICNH